jgi:hypothetical protein
MSKQPTEHRKQTAATQRARRARMTRVDYMPGDDAVAILRAKRAQERPGTPAATNSAVLDSILTDWAQLTGLKYSQIDAPQASGSRPEFADEYARANDFGFCQAKRAHAHARMTSGLTKPKVALRVPCGARRRRDGLPCEALSVPGKRRCKWHGGMSTGPHTEHGRANSIANLRRNWGKVRAPISNDHVQF